MPSSTSPLHIRTFLSLLVMSFIVHSQTFSLHTPIQRSGQIVTIVWDRDANDPEFIALELDGCVTKPIALVTKTRTEQRMFTLKLIVNFPTLRHCVIQAEGDARILAYSPPFDISNGTVIPEPTSSNLPSPATTQLSSSPYIPVVQNATKTKEDTSSEQRLTTTQPHSTTSAATLLRSSSNLFPAGPIIGGTLGGLVFLSLCLAFTTFLCRRRSLHRNLASEGHLKVSQNKDGRASEAFSDGTQTEAETERLSLQVHPEIRDTNDGSSVISYDSMTFASIEQGSENERQILELQGRLGGLFSNTERLSIPLQGSALRNGGPVYSDRSCLDLTTPRPNAHLFWF